MTHRANHEATLCEGLDHNDTLCLFSHMLPVKKGGEIPVALTLHLRSADLPANVGQSGCT